MFGETVVFATVSPHLYVLSYMCTYHTRVVLPTAALAWGRVQHSDLGI